MDILLTNRTLETPGGSETWLMTMATELIRKGHNVHVYTPGSYKLILGQTSRQLNVHRDGNEYDLGLVNHIPVVPEHILASCEKVIHTRHGIIPSIEQPREGADAYVGVSEESVRYNESIGYESSVIRNGIDLSRFPLREKPPTELRSVLLLSNNADRTFHRMLEEALPEANVNAIGRSFGQVTDVRPMMEHADLVVSLGRGCYEAMAMGTPVLVADIKGGDGLATIESLPDFRQNNCSGRFGKNRITVAWLKTVLAGYDPSIGPALRDYVEINNNVEHTAEQYLELCAWLEMNSR